MELHYLLRLFEDTIVLAISKGDKESPFRGQKAVPFPPEQALSLCLAKLLIAAKYPCMLDLYNKEKLKELSVNDNFSPLPQYCVKRTARNVLK